MASGMNAFFVSWCVWGGQYFCIFLNANSHLLFVTFLFCFSVTPFLPHDLLFVHFERFMFTPLGLFSFLGRTMLSFFVCFPRPFFCVRCEVGHLQKRQRKQEHQRWVGVFTIAFSSSKGAGYRWSGFAFSDEGVCSFLRASTSMMSTRSSTDKWLTKQEIWEVFVLGFFSLLV